MKSLLNQTDIEQLKRLIDGFETTKHHDDELSELAKKIRDIELKLKELNDIDKSKIDSNYV